MMKTSKKPKANPFMDGKMMPKSMKPKAKPKSMGSEGKMGEGTGGNMEYSPARTPKTKDNKAKTKKK